MRYVLVFLFVSCSLFSFAQETEKEELIVHKIGGKEYYIHVVDTGNTLFATKSQSSINRYSYVGRSVNDTVGQDYSKRFR